MKKWFVFAGRFILPVLAAGLLLIPAVRGEAAANLSKEFAVLDPEGPGKTAKETAGEFDWDGDRQADALTISVTGTKKDDNGAIEKIVIKLGKKQVWKKTFSQPYDYTAAFDYIKLSSVGSFLHIRCIGDNDYSTFDQILYFHPTTMRFVAAADLFGLAHTTEIKKVSAKTVTITCTAQPDLTGLIKYNLQYKWKAGKNGAPGKLMLVSKKVKATSLLDEMQPKDKYTKLFKKNQFKTKKKVKFYKSPTSYKKAFTVKKGKKVTLKKIYVMKSSQCCLQFAYGKKTGWLKNTLDEWILATGGHMAPAYKTFYGVENRLAG